MISLHWIDWTIISLYFAFLLYVTIISKKKERENESSYLLAGRTLTLPAFVATLVSTWYGGILGVGEYSFKYGISNWLVFGVPYYIAALLFAFFLAKSARKSLVFSISDQLEKAFGRNTAIVGAGVVFIMTVPAAYVLMVGILMQAVFGGPLALWVVVGTLFSTIYVSAGGFRSVVRTDILQFFLMYLGFALLLGFCYHTFGGYSFLKNNVPPSHLTWNGGVPIFSILVWYVLALSTLVEPSFYQRCYAAKKASTARAGIVISVGFWAFFDFMTTFCGLYARAVLDPSIEPMLSFPLLASKVLPYGLSGLFFLGLVAVIMSTIDSYSFIAAQTLGRDIIARYRNDLTSWSHKRIQYALLASSLFAIFIALWKGSAIDVWHDLGSIGTPMLLLPLCFSYSEKIRFNSKWMPHVMILSGATAFIWTLMGSYGSEYPFGIKPVFAGLAICIIGLLILYLFRSRSQK